MKVTDWPARITVITRPVSVGELDSADCESTCFVVSSVALTAFDERLFERFTRRRAMVISFVDGQLGSLGLCAALTSDFFTMSEEASLTLADQHFGVLAASLVWRIGPSARRLLLSGKAVVSATEARSLELCDEIVTEGTDPLKWLRSWLGTRSLPALATATSLLRMTGNHVVERYEFSRLFCTGEPQKGLNSFLLKRVHRFTDSIEVHYL